MKKFLTLMVFVLFVSFLSAQTFNVPDILYYKFNSGTTTTPNYAIPGGGTNPAQLMNMTMGSTGQFDQALEGAGGTGTTTYLNTGWNMDLGTSSWTISLWFAHPTTGTAYFFGNDITTSFRCFTNGAAGAGNITLRGTGITNVNVTGVLPGPSVVHFVYDSVTSSINTYVNGVFQTTVTQVPLNLSAAVPFKVGSYGTASSIPVGALIDEFRFYRRALNAVEITATWNQTLNPVPVELTAFTASVSGNDVQLNWSTATEINNRGFFIERKNTTGDFEIISFVRGAGSTTVPQNYIYNDNNVEAGKYQYRLKQTDFDGTTEYSNFIEVEVTTPKEFSLRNNYPNPFNPSTAITFNLAVDAHVSLEIFNLLGESISKIVNSNMTAGSHEVKFNASNLHSGVYFYRITAAGIDGTKFSSVKKMILSK